MTVYETDEIIERVILVGVAFDTDDDTERSLDELGELAKTAGAQTVGRMIQEITFTLQHILARVRLKN